MEDLEPPPIPHDEDSRNTRIISNLKDSLLSQLFESNPSLSINTDRVSSFIQRRLPQLFPSFHTPNHPAYALMIRMAIMEIDEINGLTEEAISHFIKREYKDLPWAHVRILGLQLKKLCEDGEIVCNEGGRYVLVVDGGGGGTGDGEGTVACKGIKERKRGKKRNNHGNGERKGRMERCEGVERDNELQEEGIIKEQIQVSELDGARTRTDEPCRMVECTQEEQGEEAQNPSIERVEEQAEAEKGLLEVVGEQSQSQGQGTGVIEQHAEAEAPAQSEVKESQIQDFILHLEAICSSQQTALNLPVDSQQPLLAPISEGLPKCIPSAGIELSLTQLQLQMPCHRPSENSLGAAAKTSASLSSLDVHEHKQDENPVSGDPEQQTLKRQCRGRPPKSKPVADYRGESLLPSGDVTATAQKPYINKIEKQWLLQSHGQGIGRGRHRKLHGNKIEKQWLSQPRGQDIGWGRRRKLHRNAHQFKEQIRPQDQAQCLASFPYSDQKETINSSQPTTLIFPVNLTHNFGQQWVVPISEGSPECIISTRIKLSPTELQLQISSDIDLGTTSKMEASLAYVNVHDEKLQHCNQGSPKGNLDENSMYGDPEQKPPKRPRGRPPKLKNVVNYPGELLLPSDDGILNTQNPNINKMERQLYGRGRGRGRGRPPKLNRNANQHEKLLQQEDQAEQHGQRRGRGRPPKLNRNANQCEEQLQQEDQAQQHGRGRGRGRPPKLNRNTIQFEEHLQPQDQTQGLKQQLLPQVRSRGRGRPTKESTHVEQSQWQQLQTCQRLCLESALNSLSDANESLQQLQPQLCEVEGHQQKQSHQQGQGWDQSQDLGLEKPPNPMLDANQSHQLLQPQACEDQGRLRGRPPKQN